MKGTKDINNTMHNVKDVNNDNLKEKTDKNVTQESPKVILDKMSLALLNIQSGRYSELEMEAKFGTRGIKVLTKMDYDNVVKKLRSKGWSANSPSGDYLLRTQPEFLDIKIPISDIH